MTKATHNTLPAANLRAGVPTNASRRKMQAIQARIEQTRNPHSFALMFNRSGRPDTSIIWSHNTDLHFGYESMGYGDYVNFIHPRWADIYFAYATAAYSIAEDKVHKLAGRNACYTVLVPLLHIDGNYYWYRQVSIPCAFDEEGGMVTHLSHYHRAADYGRLQPGSPIVTINDRRKPRVEGILRRRSQAVLSRIFYKDLTQRERSVLHSFRKLQINSREEVSNEQVSRMMKLAIGTINKNNTRILTKAKEVLPLNTFYTLSELASFLNNLFGIPK